MLTKFSNVVSERPSKSRVGSSVETMVVVAVVLWLLPVCFAAGSGDPLHQHLRARLEHLSQESPLEVGTETIHASRVLPAFYEARLYEPAWISDIGLSESASDLVSAIQEASSHGLVPGHYHLSELEEGMARAGAHPQPALLADLDILLTDAFLMLGAHLVSGRVDPETLDSEWVAYRREVDLADSLERAIETGDPRTVLAELLPNHRGYERLRSALDRYRELASTGGWVRIAAGAPLRQGDSDDRVESLRARLESTDSEVPELGVDERIYGSGLAAAVARFQRRHGLDPDGVVGEKTLAALNTSVEDRIGQIEINLERWRWLPQDLGSRYVLVNIPSLSLIVVDEGKKILEMKVAVGRKYRKTPVFSDTIRYLVINPFWEVPHRLAVEDKLPEIQRDPGFLAKLGFKVYQGWGADQALVDPASVDWTQLGPSRFPYRLRQDPGPLNALGRMKFMFPNRFNVYLHDTPNHEVFLRSERDVSSGCIRLEKPLELAVLLLDSPDRWSRKALDETITEGAETTVTLRLPVPVHLLYWTAWSDEEGTVHFRRDIYGRDEMLKEALERGGSRPMGGAS